jgi:hypothetical protein
MKRIRNNKLRDQVTTDLVLTMVLNAIELASNRKDFDTNEIMGFYLKPLGFIEKDAYASDPNAPCVPIWIHKKAGIIVKNPFYVSDFAPSDEHRLPTYSHRNYVIQPFVKLPGIRARRKGMDAMMKSLGAEFVYDINELNICLWKDRWVLLDW